MERQRPTHQRPDFQSSHPHRPELGLAGLQDVISSEVSKSSDKEVSVDNVADRLVEEELDSGVFDVELLGRLYLSRRLLFLLG